MSKDATTTENAERFDSDQSDLTDEQLAQIMEGDNDSSPREQEGEGEGEAPQYESVQALLDAKKDELGSEQHGKLSEEFRKTWVDAEVGRRLAERSQAERASEGTAYGGSRAQAESYGTAQDQGGSAQSLETLYSNFGHDVEALDAKIAQAMAGGDAISLGAELKHILEQQARHSDQRYAQATAAMIQPQVQRMQNTEMARAFQDFCERDPVLKEQYAAYRDSGGTKVGTELQRFADIAEANPQLDWHVAADAAKYQTGNSGTAQRAAPAKQQVLAASQMATAGRSAEVAPQPGDTLEELYEASRREFERTQGPARL